MIEKKKIQGNIFINVTQGRRNKICFKNITNRIVSGKWYEERKANVEDGAYESLKRQQNLPKRIRSLITCDFLFLLKSSVKASDSAL